MPDKQLTLFSETVLQLMNEGKLQVMKDYIQHGSITTLDHSLMVAYYSWRLNQRLGLKADESSLIRGALLHDYFLYDWHVAEKWHRFHGFRHPAFALKNARQDYQLNEIEEEIIKKHMWPLTIIPPTCREAWIVNAMDTFSSVVEVMMEYRLFSVLKRKWYERLDKTVFKDLKKTH